MHPPDQDPRRGIALVLVLIFVILLYVIVAELVTTAQMVRLTGENDVLIAQMRNHVAYVLTQVEDQLRDDLAAASAQEGGQGAGALPGMPGSGGSGGQGGGESTDSSQDSWYEPTGYADGDLTTYVWVEDENRKFNILALVSPDQDFARESRARFVRLIDVLREDTLFDLSVSDGEQLATGIIEWLEGKSRSQQIPRPPLKSDDPERQEITVPLHLDELMMLRGISDDLFFDKLDDGKIVLGLESVLTVFTSLKYDPGDPTQPKKSNLTQRTNRPGSENQQPQQPPQPVGPGGRKPPENPVGIGIKINLNTVPRPVLRCLFAESEVPDAVLDAILRYRNEEQPEEETTGEGAAANQPSPSSATDYNTDLGLGAAKKKKIFKSVQDLDQLPEFMNLANVEIKNRFYQLLTTKSDVFSVHMAALHKRNEETRSFVLRRSRTILFRSEGSEETLLHPLIRMEERAGVRIQPIDFLEQHDEELRLRADGMDSFALEERKWNPFFREFYLPKDRLPWQ
jgi:hypothetical protein